MGSSRYLEVKHFLITASVHTVSQPEAVGVANSHCFVAGHEQFEKLSSQSACKQFNISRKEVHLVN